MRSKTKIGKMIFLVVVIAAGVVFGEEATVGGSVSAAAASQVKPDDSREKAERGASSGVMRDFADAVGRVAKEDGAVEGEKRPGPNANLERLLREEGLNFEFIADVGAYKLAFELPNNRSQVVLLPPIVNRVGDYCVYSVVSLASDHPISKAQAMLLLRQEPEIGAWHYAHGNTSFGCNVPTDIMARDLASVLRFVATTADELEAEWSDEDKF